MLSRMYLWRLLPSATSGGSLGHGTCVELAAAMRLTEPALIARLVFMVAISELAPRISVDDLVPCYVPTGREWHARRTRDDKPRWSARLVPVDPDFVYYPELEEVPDEDLPAPAPAVDEPDAADQPDVPDEPPAPSSPQADAPR
jgi:hypothetical protein